LVTICNHRSEQDTGHGLQVGASSTLLSSRRFPPPTVAVRTLGQAMQNYHWLINKPVSMGDRNRRVYGPQALVSPQGVLCVSTFSLINTLLMYREVTLTEQAPTASHMIRPILLAMLKYNWIYSKATSVTLMPTLNGKLIFLSINHRFWQFGVNTIRF